MQGEELCWSNQPLDCTVDICCGLKFLTVITNNYGTRWPVHEYPFQTGCAEKIPALVKASPSLSPLLWCLRKIYFKDKYRCRAYKGTTNSTASGTLCCCNVDCFIMFVLFHSFFKTKNPERKIDNENLKNLTRAKKQRNG